MEYLLLNQLFQYLYNGIGFYIGFDILHESGTKYLPPDLLAECETEFLYAFWTVFGKHLFLVWQQFHCTITDVDQVDQHLNSLSAAYHIAA